jgi:hypothetical protein
MSNPETTATQPNATDGGKTVDSDKTPTPEELAAIAEKRRRDTQAAYTKSQQKLKALEAEREKLLALAEKAIKPQLSAEEREELEVLKYEDPEAWREKLNSFEAKAQSEARAKLDELTGEAKVAAERDFELSRRQQVLEEFNASAEVPITDEIIANDVPPRITKKLEEGTVSFEEFLEEVSAYLKTGKVVANEETLNQPNLSKVSGKTSPTDEKPETSLKDAYKNDLY